MRIFLLVISALSFIAAFGIHMYAKNGASGWCGYMTSPALSSIPWVSGFILAVVPECLLFDLFWVWMALINLVVVWIIGPFTARLFLVRLSSGKGAGIDVLTAIIIGIVTLAIGASIG